MRSERIAFLSDVHGRMTNLWRALAEIRKEKIRTILFSGDLEALHLLPLFADFRLYYATGPDFPGDLHELRMAFARAGQPEPASELRLSLSGAEIILRYNSPEKEPEFPAGNYPRYVVTGDGKNPSDIEMSEYRVLGAGSLSGGNPGVGILDPESGQVQIITLKAE